MNSDLKIIKKYYGEDMMHYARDNFSIILENEGKLSNLFLNNFAESKTLYEDLSKNNELVIFKNFIYRLYYEKIDKDNNEIINIKTPTELMNDAGYDLYECKTEDDIQSFKKYYSKEEELCTFKGGRLYSNRVFFAVKKNVDNIKRENFKNPEREDEYGTSVISIQFTKDEIHNLSIKNRYNHTVRNPDATFKNNLENIMLGLTKSFEKYYGIKQKFIIQEEFKDFVRASDGKYYKYNFEFVGMHYCPNNTVIDYDIINQYDKEKYILMDYFILDLQNKCFITNRFVEDGFIETIKDIKKIEVRRKKNNKLIIFKTSMEDIKVEVDNRGLIVGYINNNITKIPENFMKYNKSLKYLELNNVQFIDNNFMTCCNSTNLKRISFPKVKTIGNNFMMFCEEGVEELYFPNVQKIGDSFLTNLQNNFKVIDFPNLKYTGVSFMSRVDSVKIVNLPMIECLEEYFLYHNKVTINYFNIKNCKTIKNNVLLYGAVNLDNSNFNSVEVVGDCFLMFSKCENKTLNMPNVREIGKDVLVYNKFLESVNIPKCKKVGKNFLSDNIHISELYIDELESMGRNCFLNFLTYNRYNYMKLSDKELVIKLKKIFKRKNFIAKLEKSKKEIIQNIYSKSKILKK